MENPWNIHGQVRFRCSKKIPLTIQPRASKKALRLARAWQVQHKVLNAEGKEVLRDVAFELNDLNDGKTEVQTPSRDISGCS